jgi:hypothetical protein
MDEIKKGEQAGSKIKTRQGSGYLSPQKFDHLSSQLCTH